MLKTILGIFTTALAILCLAYKAALYGVLEYIRDKKYTLPTQKELRACIRKYLEKRYLQRP